MQEGILLGDPRRSGKLLVLQHILPQWKEQGHRVLLFAQTQQMLDILERYIIRQDFEYRRMDGGTPVAHRMELIDEFNNDDSIFLFALTTKVGGVGKLIPLSRIRIILQRPKFASISHACRKALLFAWQVLI